MSSVRSYKSVSYLTTVNGPTGIRYYVRISVPKALRLVFQKREIKKRLPTHELQIARLQAAYYASSVLDLFRRIHSMDFIINRTPEGNELVSINTLNIQCEQELTQIFSNIRGLSSNPEVVLNAAERGLNQQFKPSTSIRISDFFNQMSKLKQDNGDWNPNVAKENTAIFDLLIEVIGNKLINDIKFEDAEFFFNTVSRLPKNRKKNPAFKSLSLAQTLQLNPEPMADDNINKYMSRVSQIFNQAESRDLMIKNPFANQLLRKKSKIKAKDQRQHYNAKDLKKLLSSELFASPDRINQSFYWTILMLLYTGARLNEIAQLHVKDIKKVDGIWAIEHVNCCDKKSFKTTNLEGAIDRITPIHKELIQLGFLGHVEKIKKSERRDEDGSHRLFPDYTYTEKAKFGKKCSEFFNGKNGNDGYKHKIGLLSEQGRTKLDIHSFRHTLATNLQEAGIPRTQSFAITGHSEKNAPAGERYRKGYTLAQLQEAINKISFIEHFNR